jgi:predicted Zn-dependent protease with MMP-like domain
MSTRCEGAKYLDMEEVPVTIITDTSFDSEQAEVQLLRHNMIHGSLHPEKFMELYAKYSSKYEDDLIQEMFGFADDAEFNKLIKQTEKSLPPEYKEAFKDAAKEIKTVDDLAKVLNKLFTEHGSDLEYNYMIVDFGGRESMWVRMNSSASNTFEELGDVCKEHSVTMDALIGELVEALLHGGHGLDTAGLVASLPEAEEKNNVYNAEDELNDD